jgi:crotonobetainyl-CoA:carnitine CoA-transferase CaiB-like acyl-CoA transferase
MEVSLPLTGVTVVAFEQAVAAPLCTRHLADLGARVIKVEHPSGGDFTRSYDTAVHGLSSYFVWLNRNKESVAVDARKPGGAEVIERLVARADVVVQNLAPGAAARLNVAAAQVVAAHPRAVAVDISGYGTGGPYDHKRAYDLLIQAEGGVCSITGEAGHPAKAGPPLADLGAALHAVSGILAALFDRERTGRGAVLEVAMFDVVADWMSFALQYTRHTGTQRQPNGMSTPMVAPYGAFPTSGGQTVLLGTTNDAEWQRLATDLIGRRDLAADPRLASNEGRCAHRAEIDAAIARWTGARDLALIQDLADAAGIGNARYNTVSDVLAHPQLTERGRWQPVGSPAGPVEVLLPAVVSPGWTPRLDPVPALGEHTRIVLADLGYSDGEVEELAASSALISSHIDRSLS